MAKAATSRRGRKPAQNQTAALLTAAIDFLSIVPDKKEKPNTIVFNGPIVSVNNGIVKAGIILGEGFPSDVTGKVVLSAFAGALASVGKEMELAFGDDFVTIEAGDFKAELPKLEIDLENDTANPSASGQIYPINNEFRVAVGKVAIMASDTGEETMTASIAITGESVMATKRHTVLEAWHGNNMPSGMIFLPKSFALALAKTTANIVGFSFTDKSFSVFFDNNSYLQTNTVPDAWFVDGKPSDYLIHVVHDLVNGDGIDILATDKLGLALKQIAAVTKAEVWMTLGHIRSVDDQVSLDVKESIGDFMLDPARYLAVEPLINTARFVKWTSPTEPSRLLVYGDKLRGCIMVSEEAPKAEPEPTQQAAWGGTAATPLPAAAGGWGAPAAPLASAASAPETSMAPAPSAGQGWGSPASAPTLPATTAFPSSGQPQPGFGGDDD